MKFIKEYKLELLIGILFVLSRLPSLGHDTFNTDVWKWKARTYDFGTGIFTLNLDKTVQKYHPGVPLMWVGALAVKFFNLYSANSNLTELQEIFMLHAFQKFFVILTTGIILTFIFYPLRKMFGTIYALISISLIAIEPFYIALSREYHLEGLMTTFMVASLVWYYFYLFNAEGKSRFYLYISALFGSLAVLTKTSALIFLPMILYMDVMGKKKKTDLRNLLTWGLVFILSSIIIWPVLVTNPILVFEVLYKGIFTIGIEGEHLQLFNNKWVEDPGALFYPTVFLYRSSLYLLLGLLGFSFVYKSLKVESAKNEAMKKFFSYSILSALFYVVILTLSTKKLDRYILPGMVLLIFPAAYFFEVLLQRLKFSSILKTVLFLAPAIFYAVYLHPNYFSYYSPLAGGLRKGIFVLEPKWMFGQIELQRALQLQMQADGLKKFEQGESLDEFVSTEAIKQKFTAGFPEKYYTQMWPFIEEIGGKATILDIAEHVRSSNYVVYPVWDDKSSVEDRVRLEYIDSVFIKGTETYKIYRVFYFL